jgi:hypothetical protein
MPTNAVDLDEPLTEQLIIELQCNGYTSAGRYIKNLTQAELTLCANHAFPLWLISEGWGSEAVFEGGAKRGHQDGLADLAKLQALGVPSGVVVYCAVDFGATVEDVPEITAYRSGYAAAQPDNRIGLYADGTVASAIPCPVGDYMPGAPGWPGYAEYIASGHAAIVQGQETKLFGQDVDLCEVLDRSVLWQPQAPASAQGEQTTTINPMPELAAAQTFLGITADGVWGPQTAEAFAKYYEANA